MPKHSKYAFPKEDASFGEPARPHAVLGTVRTKVEYNSAMTPDSDDDQLCKNYFNKAVLDLVSRSKDQGGDAVKNVRSVVFLLDGRQEFHKSAECADEGGIGQVLAEATAIRWKPLPSPSPSLTP
jgi:hypothetical protein